MKRANKAGGEDVMEVCTAKSLRVPAHSGSGITLKRKKRKVTVAMAKERGIRLTERKAVRAEKKEKKKQALERLVREMPPPKAPAKKK